MNERRGGIVVRVEGSLLFLPAAAASRVLPLPQVTRLPGAPSNLVGLAVYDDEIVPIISIGSARGAMILCTYRGERLGLVGAEIAGTGLFDGIEGGGVELDGERAKPLDLATICASVDGANWAGRWGG